jgi:hypothetical protein
MVPIFGGIQAKTTVNNDFNYYASQCRICIEMAFGLMVQKWRICGGGSTTLVGFRTQ